MVPILATAARGKKWIFGSGPHSCWLGFNEYAQRRTLSREVAEGDVVWDIGANVGSYTILASTLVGQTGKVLAFEPLPVNIDYLKRHIRLNELKNVSVYDMAVYDRCGTVRFHVDEDRVLGCVDQQYGGLEVETANIDWLVGEGGVPVPDVLKIDVEGGELHVLKGATDVLSEKGPIVFLSTHGQEVKADCLDLLQSVGYELDPIDQSASELLARPS